MSLRINQISIPVDGRTPEQQLPGAIAAKLDIPEDAITGIRIKKKSLDARKKSNILFHYRVEFDVTDEASIYSKNASHCQMVEPGEKFHPLDDLDLHGKEFRARPVIVGSGPAGIFAALALVLGGQKPIIIDRGEAVENRVRTVNRLRRNGILNEESNYCFGEGGAGTFSDGKLTCGRNHPLIEFIFEQWVAFGAPEEILYDAHPHIGTDFLMQIALRMRQFLQERGASFLFNRRLMDLGPGVHSRLKMTLDGGEHLETDSLILAIGHSARDTYEMLWNRQVAIQPKPFAMGARIEHPQEQINQIQYGSCAFLPAAEYKLAAHEGDRGIWTFCMCPGGHLLPTSAQEGHLAINGMSYHARNSGFANAAIVVNVRREDFYRDHPLDGVRFQQAVEQKAYLAGGGSYFAPAQRLEDFLAGRDSQGELTSTYKPGVKNARLDLILPDFITSSLKKALHDYNKKMRGYISHGAIVAGLESKTSAPLIIQRDKGFQSISTPGLYPAGEGAGFAGGIVSASLDGLKVGSAVLQELISSPSLRA